MSTKKEITDWCSQQNVSMQDLTPYQCRLSKGVIVCDVYWKRMRYHLIKHTEESMIQQRGEITDGSIFLESVFE